MLNQKNNILKSKEITDFEIYEEMENIRPHTQVNKEDYTRLKKAEAWSLAKNTDRTKVGRRRKDANS